MSSDSTWMTAETIRSLRLVPSDSSVAEFAIDTLWIRPDFN